MADVAPEPVLSAHQCRRARELLGWNMFDLAEASGVRMVTLMKIEDGRKPPPVPKVERVRRTFEEAGVEFPAGEAPRARPGPSGPPP